MNPPEKIYLQWYDDLGQEPLGPLDGDVTWCEDEIYDTDICYVRELREKPKDGGDQ